ncbi:MAG: Gfo/Idh/MocA family protein [Christensenellales bacterium]|jgi:predicted dehydrogenase
MKEIKIGIIGANWMGSYHAMGFSKVRQTYGTEVVPVFGMVADMDEEKAKIAYERFGFEKWSTKWQDVIEDPSIDLVIIATPNFTHPEIAIAAANAKKHIICEKPMANTLEEGCQMVEAAKKNGIISAVGFIYTYCPVQAFAKQLIESGELGDFISFRGQFDLDYCADPNTPSTWRQYAKYAGTGALGDVTAHIVSLSDMLVGEIEEVCAVSDIVYKERPKSAGSSEKVAVDTDDQVYLMVKYQNGRIGAMSSSRVVNGKAAGLGYEIQGTKGTIIYSLDRINEVELFIKGGDPEQKGFKTLKGNQLHGEYKHISQMNELGVAYHDVLCIQAHTVLEAIAKNRPLKLDIAYGHKVDRILAAAQLSDKERRWVKVSEL